MLSLSVLAIANSGLALFEQIFLALFALGYAVLLLTRQQFTGLRFNTGWYLSTPKCGEYALQLQQATIWPMLIVMRFRDPQYSRFSVRSSYALLLLRDQLSADDWRHLRIYLRHFNVYGELSFDDIN